MKEIKKIIVPVDYNEHTHPLVDYAFYIAEKLGASVTLVHVVEKPHYYGDIEYPTIAPYTEELGKEAEKIMQALVEKYRKDFAACEGKVLHGDIADSIIKYSADEQGDLLIIGTHGRRGLEKMWLGSVADRVIKGAPCPTLTCNPYKKMK